MSFLSILRLGRQSPLRYCSHRRANSSISALQAAFRDPSSPYHIPPGTQGPASPDEVPGNRANFSTTTSSPLAGLDALGDPVQEAHAKFVEAGFDLKSIYEQKIVWGDHDQFQHVNNVRYVRFFESSRIHWMQCVGHRLGGAAKAEAIIRGKGISLILKSIEVKYRRPVTFPDTLIIAHRPYIPPASAVPVPDPAAIYLTASAYSLGQRAFVASANEVAVWYDYDKLRKCTPAEDVKDAVWGTGD